MGKRNIRLYKEGIDYDILSLARRNAYANKYIRKISRVKLWALVLVA